jgi:hypothetical protein
MPYEKFNIIRGKQEETLQLWARKFEFLFNKNLNVDNVVSTGLIVPADLVTVDDTGGYFASSNGNVEDVLQQIGSTLQSIPAGNVKIVDAGLYYTSTSVEGALQEIASTITNIPSSNISAIQASTVTIADGNNFYTGTEVETALQEIGYKITTLTGNSVLGTSNQGYVMLNSTATFTVTLPAISSDKRWYRLRNINTATVTIETNTTDLIDESTSFDLYQDESLNIIDTGTQWREG